MLKPVDTRYWGIRTQLKAALNQPLAGGRGFQERQDQNIHRLARELALYQLPER